MSRSAPIANRPASQTLTPNPMTDTLDTSTSTRLRELAMLELWAMRLDQAREELLVLEPLPDVVQRLGEIQFLRGLRYKLEAGLRRPERRPHARSDDHTLDELHRYCEAAEAAIDAATEAVASA